MNKDFRVWIGLFLVLLLGFINGFLFHNPVENYFLESHINDYKDYSNAKTYTIPEIYFKNLNSLNFESERTKGYYLGRYYVSSKDIYIYTGNQDSQEVESTIRHELGHHIWYIFLDENERNEWKTIFNEIPNMVNLIDYEEDFAESIDTYFNMEDYYLNCYFDNNCAEESQILEPIRQKFIIENIIQKYEPEKYLYYKNG